MRTGIFQPLGRSLSLLIVLWLIVACGARAEKRSHGEQLYAENCSACHLIGKNIIKPEKTILRSDRLKSIAEFKSFLSHENGMMPAYKTIVANEKDLRDLYGYIEEMNRSEKKTK